MEHYVHVFYLFETYKVVLSVADHSYPKVCSTLGSIIPGPDFKIIMHSDLKVLLVETNVIRNVVYYLEFPIKCSF